MQKKKWVAFWDKLENCSLLANIRSAFIMTIPVILAGSVALIVQTLLDMTGLDFAPLRFVRDVAALIHNATFGILSLIMSMLICVKSLEKKGKRVNVLLGAPIAMAGFVILTGGLELAVEHGSLGVKGMFTAIVTAVLAAELYDRFSRLLSKKDGNLYGNDRDFQEIVASLPAIFCTVAVFSLINQLIALLTPADNFNELFSMGITLLVGSMGGIWAVE